ncbi:MAG: class I SAM-dependent methyltransferase [Synechococcales bacterium]|nr:class I SAM-dependent methyltransferase [Synechococcales bacterium]
MNLQPALGREESSLAYWATASEHYVGALANAYHTHRLQVIRSLIPNALYCPGQTIFDFGCGDAVLFPEFLAAGAQISGIDIAPEMIVLAHQHLRDQGYETSLAKQADVDYLTQIPTASLDALLSFNVLAYLTDTEEQQFYREAQRIVKPGGYLIVTHSNQLFDLFSCNHYTVEFFKQQFATAADRDRLDALFSWVTLPEQSVSNAVSYNVRENPLSYRYKLADYGFQELHQEFIHFHPLPPALLTEKTYVDTLQVAERDRWKLMFMCSTFGSCAIRQ